ncbi:MAG: Unknown protein [uncultured Sulfurovum sp.]|uniref:Uncharacterized protein n=1 Tax=uncultured Sulfurovum sp. TaxID=269237 RepID=A0A6S6TTA4_9BACT|nr:MAG: Unknown protein [uncultured Sulfurovum sp.]
MTLFVMGLLIGCDNDNNNDGNSETVFATDVKAVLSQSENDEPLEISDSVDTTTNFDALL